MQFSALFSYMLWHIELKFCIWLRFTVLQIKFECCQFPSIFVRVIPLLECRIWKYTVFHTFLLYPLTFWAEILHFTLFYCTTDQVRVSSICVKFLYAHLQTERIMVWRCPSVRPSDSSSGSPSARFPHFSPTCFNILSWNFAHDFVLMYYRSSFSVVTLRQFLK